jgi:hypothetical protein
MKNALIAAYSELIHHQTEITSIVEGVIKDGHARGLTEKSEEVLAQMTALNDSMTALANELPERYAIVLPMH